MSDDIKAPLLGRDGMGVSIELRKEDDKTVRLSFPASSEAPVERWFGEEILSHSKGAIRMDRISRGAMPLLFNHNWDEPVGVVDGARVENNRLVVDAHLFATARAQEIAAMVEGGLRNVSIGYRLHVVEEDKKAARFTATDWEPFEVSIVTVPADPTVGIGRQLGGEEFEVRMVRASLSSNPAKPAATLEKAKMADGNDAAAGASADDKTEVRIEAGKQAADANFAAENEKRRVQAIRNLAKVNGIGEDTVQAWVTRGSDLNAVADDILSIHKQRGESKPQSISALGLSGRETTQYSLCRAILAAHSNDWKNAGFELECHNAIAERSNKPQERGHFYVPLEVQRRSTPFDGQSFIERNGQNFGHLARDLNVGTAGAGGFLVQTSNASFDELLRNISFAFRMGATRLTGLRDNITIPRQSAAATAEWLTSETAGATESQQTFVQLSMAPKTVGAYTEVSRKLLLQASIDVEGLVNADLAAVAALAVDSASVNGTGTSGQPLGLLNVTGVGSVSGSSLGFAGILETQTDLATGNVMPLRGGYVTTPTVAGLMMAEVMFSNTASPLWVGNIWNGNMMGFPAMSTNQMPAGTMIFGDWSKLVVGEWGVLEIDTNPYASFAAGIIGVRALYSVDVGVRYPVAFTAATSIT